MLRGLNLKVGHDLIADNLFDPQNGLYDIIDPKVSRALFKMSILVVRQTDVYLFGRY